MTLEYLLRLQNGQFMGPVRQATAGVGGLNKSMGDMRQHSGTVNSLGGAFGGLAGKIAAAFTAWKAAEAVFSGFKKSIGLAADAETTATAFKTLVGSATEANAVLAKVKKMADSTPFEFPELAGAARMLVAFGEAAKDVPETLRRLGDVSAGVAAPIGEIAEIYGKARTQGQLFAEDINQLTGRGIPVIKELAKVLSKPEGEIKKLAEEGKITFPLLDQAFRNMTAAGGQFYDMMKQQAGTTHGMLSTLQDGVNDLFKTFGTPLNDAIKPLLQDAMGLIEQLKPAVIQLGGHTADAVTAVRDFVAEAGAGSGLAAAMGKKLKEAFEEAADVIGIPFRAIGAALPTLAEGFMALLRPVGEWLMAKLESASLRFSSNIMVGIRDALDALSKSSMMAGMIPGLEDAADSLNGPAAMAHNDSLNADSRADRIGESMPGAMDKAAERAGDAMAAFREKFSNELARIGAGESNAAGAGRMFGQMPGFDNKGMVGYDEDGSAPGSKEAIKAANAPKASAAADKKAGAQKDFLSLEQKELMLLKAKADGNLVLAAAMEKRLKLLKLAETYQDKGGMTDEKALAAAREKLALQERLQQVANVPLVPAAVKRGMTPTAEDDTGGPRKIHGYHAAPYDAGFTPGAQRDSALDKMNGGSGNGGALSGRGSSGIKKRMMSSGLDQFMRNQQRDGQDGSALGSGALSRRPPRLTVPSPGATKAEQGRREATATASRNNGERSRWDLVAAIAAKMNTLAPA